MPDKVNNLSELKTSHVGHDNVCHYQVDAKATGQHTQGQLPIACFDDAIALLSEPSNELLAHVVLILDDEDGSWLRRLVRHGSVRARQPWCLFLGTRPWRGVVGGVAGR